MDVTLLPAHKQAALIAGRDISARELLELVVARHEVVGAVLNAVVVERVDAARELARAADEAVVAGAELGAFHGVPVTVKEVIDWVGTPSTWGDPRHANYMPHRNAAVLDRLFASGAVVWGKTNVPLGLGDWQTHNEIYGRTNNPFDPTRTAGGSSGGSAVSLAVGLAGLEIGSDIGGSIRFPAHYCGVYGHKPSFATVPAAGHTYPGQAADVDINVVGPMARSARDLETAMQLLAERVLVTENRDSLADFTVGVMFENPCGGEQDDEMTAVLEATVESLIRAGVTVSRAPQRVEHVRAQQNYLLLNYTATSLMTKAEHVEHVSHNIWLQLANERQRIRDTWSEYFDEVDLLLCPVAASAAPLHQTEVPFSEQTIQVNGRETSNQDQWFWAGVASGGYLPSTAVPVGQTAAGLPIGMQVIAPFAHDLRSIRFADLLEREMGGFVPPPMVSELRSRPF